MKLLTIIPAHNEEAAIKKTVSDFKKVNPHIDVLVVNDGSTDDTKKILELNNIDHINLPINVGLSGVVKAGIYYASQNDYDSFLQYDGDGQHLPEYVSLMIDKLNEGNDLVIGSRFLDKKKHKSMRMLGSSVLAFSIRISCRKIITDPTSGMRMFSKNIIDLFIKENLVHWESDLITWLIHNNYKVAEVPVKMIDRHTGKSYFNFFNSITYMLTILVTILLIQPFLRKNKKRGK